MQTFNGSTHTHLFWLGLELYFDELYLTHLQAAKELVPILEIKTIAGEMVVGVCVYVDVYKFWSFISSKEVQLP